MAILGERDKNMKLFSLALLFSSLVFFFQFTAKVYAQDVIGDLGNAVVDDANLSSDQSEQLVDDVSNVSDEKTTFSNFTQDKKRDQFSVKTLTGDDDVEQMVRRIIRLKVSFNPNNIRSLFFSDGESELLAEARMGLITSEEKAQEQIDRKNGTYIDPNTGENGVIDPGIRELSLGGIVYASSKDWTIWLNGTKMTPRLLAPEIIDIKVYKNYIKIKWYDSYTNQIFPIKLKTHQRFNIDTRIFLPG